MLHSALTPVHALRDDYWIPTGSVVNGFSVSAACHPASDVGGDFYAVLYADDERLGVLFGDACGKGARAARIAALVRRQLPDLVRSVQEPAEVLDQLNARLHGELADDSFVTSACFELSATYGLLTVANAGHVPLFLRCADSGRVQRVGPASGPPLGMLPERALLEPSDPSLGRRPRRSGHGRRAGSARRRATGCPPRGAHRFRAARRGASDPAGAR